MRVLGISGSLRRGSHNLALLRAVAAQLPPGAELREYAELAGIPAYSEDLDAVAPPRAVGALRAEIAASDAVIIATPEYNGSIPGALKNALDWASRPWPDNSLRDKPVCVIGASTGLFGAVWAQAELRKVLGTIGARVLEDELPVGQAHELFDARGALTDADLQSRLAELVTALVREARPCEPAAAPC
jgi:chromate reductase